MTQMVADLFERQSFSDEASGARVTQRMRSVMSSGCAQTQGRQSLRHHGVQAVTSQRQKGRFKRQEYLSVGAAAPYRLQVSGKRLPHRGQQRIGLSPATFDSPHMQQIVLPIQVLQPQLSHLRCAKAID